MDRGENRGLTAGLRFDVVKNIQGKNPAYGYALSLSASER